MNFFQRFTGHFKTITKHKYYVFRHCVKAGIFWQGITHDLSKFSPSEFFPGVKYFIGTRSPNEGERAEYGYSLAWMHHKGRNKHHYEYWTDYDMVTKQLVPVKMPIKYVVEMYCDRLAACKTYRKKDYKETDAIEYYDRKKDHRDIHPETAALIEKLLRMTAEKGEKATFEYIRTLR